MRRWALFKSFVIFMTLAGLVNGHSETGHKAEIEYSWNIVEYEWPSESMKEEEISNGNYIPENSAINGIKLYKGTVYVTVPRLKHGVPSTLNTIVENSGSGNTSSVSHVLRPFPSWDMQKLGNCTALQRVQSMEIDPSTGYMWIMDTGYTQKTSDVNVQPVDSCPAKMIIYDLDNDVEIHRYEFPKLTVGLGRFYLNDLVLGYHNNTARYAFISDTLDYKMVVYDFVKDYSFTYTHPSMNADSKYINITISNITMTNIITGINGIAMSPDFKYVYYSSVAGVGLYQIETSVLTFYEGESAGFAANVRHVGNKLSPGDGMVYGSKDYLYYSSLGENAVYRWDIRKDLRDVGGDYNAVKLKTTSVLFSDTKMDWVDSLTLSEDGYLWFTTSRLNKFFNDGVVHHEPNFIVWKVFVDDYNYMHTNQAQGPVDGSTTMKSNFHLLLALVTLVLMLFQ